MYRVTTTCRIIQSKNSDIATKFIGVSRHYSIKMYHIKVLIEFFMQRVRRKEFLPLFWPQFRLFQLWINVWDLFAAIYM